jgi:hypothetical protein
MLQILASAVALAYRNFGIARVNRERPRDEDDDPEGYVRRTWQNGVLFAELKRLQAVNANNIVAQVNIPVVVAPGLSNFSGLVYEGRGLSKTLWTWQNETLLVEVKPL